MVQEVQGFLAGPSDRVERKSSRVLLDEQGSGDGSLIRSVTMQ